MYEQLPDDERAQKVALKQGSEPVVEFISFSASSVWEGILQFSRIIRNFTDRHDMPRSALNVGSHEIDANTISREDH